MWKLAAVPLLAAVLMVQAAVPKGLHLDLLQQAQMARAAASMAFMVPPAVSTVSTAPALSPRPRPSPPLLDPSLPAAVLLAAVEDTSGVTATMSAAAVAMWLAAATFPDQSSAPIPLLPPAAEPCQSPAACLGPRALQHPLVPLPAPLATTTPAAALLPGWEVAAIRPMLGGLATTLVAPRRPEISSSPCPSPASCPSTTLRT
mmetsp:Transcript_31009/g.87831  ORF Transcript_31009/g.87831 Transcript_31009/m.87831 type:complete len:203 (-) Transcript_31009:2259-2867(-)